MQMSMFINGLKYIIPCQNQFSHHQSIDQLITEQYDKISTIIKNCLWDHRISPVDERAKQAFQALKDILYKFQTKQLPRKLQLRAQREHKIVQTIQSLLRRQRSDIIICRTDKSKVFYIGKRNNFLCKTQEYMLKTQAYQEITDGQCPLAFIYNAVQTLLEWLVKKNVLTGKQRNQLLPNETQLELSHYHAIPKPHKIGTPLRPIIASIHAPTTLISKFLNNLLAPVFLQVARHTTFINSIDVIRKLETYVTNDHLKSTTKFITCDVADLYTMIPRQGALEALARFCFKYSKQGKIGTFSIDHIMKMARLILDNNYFAYNNNKYYKQIRGGAMGSAFTQVLANIYMFEWEQDLIQYQTSQNEIYGRYIDDIFMTTNQMIDEIKFKLDEANQKDINIKISYTINTSVDFLDITITNQSGQLKTSIYHKPAAEPYILPYSSNHPHHILRNIPYAALLHAARICSHADDFNSERIHIDVSLLLNNYPPNFISKQFHRFFQSNNAMSLLNQLDEQVYRQLHQKLLYQPTRREKQLNQMMEDPIETPTVLQPKIWNKKLMYPHYMFHSKQSNDFSKEFYKWWETYYDCVTSPVHDVQIQLLADTYRTLESFFIHKKPLRDMLTKMETI